MTNYDLPYYTTGINRDFFFQLANSVGIERLLFYDKYKLIITYIIDDKQLGFKLDCAKTITVNKMVNKIKQTMF